jgi:hypothetical protein
MSTQLLFGLLLLLLFGWCDVCVVVCVCFPSSKYRYKAMVNAKVEYMYMTQLKASVLSSGAMTIWLWSLVANNYSKLFGGRGVRCPRRPHIRITANLLIFDLSRAVSGSGGKAVFEF